MRDLEAKPSQGGKRRRRSRIDIEKIVATLRGEPRWRARLEEWHRVPKRAARTAPFPERVDERLRSVLEARGIRELWTHQARAIELALQGKDVLVATATASGKTLCYTVPLLQSLLETRGAARALLLFPTKALSQDQTVGITSLVQALDAPFHAYTYDGDTPPSVRRTLRDRGHLILTNPWMLHQGILPNHGKWAELFRDLHYIVVDELHTLSGVFGSSVANVLRRLLRVARHYGSEPRFLASSATLREPGKHAERLFGRKVEVVDEDGSPSGARWFGVYNPPMLNPVAGLRRGALEEARELARAVCGPGHQTIFFCRRRTAVEVLTRYLKQAAPDLGLEASEVRGYRGGYLPLLRREIEAGLKSGKVRVVVSTNALELGIDIGALDVAVLVGYPGSQASFWQRAGRVGRRGETSLVVQIARSDPVDQYLARHPESLFRASRERLGLDPDNLVILSEQIKCAAFELPFCAPSEGSNVVEPEYAEVALLPEILDYLAEESRILHRRGDTWYWMADAYPAQDVTLKGTEPDNVVILDMDGEKAIGEIDRAGSITAVHEGAIYLVEGETWRIERFDYENRRAYARRVSSDYFTDAETDTEVRVLRLEARRARLLGGRSDYEVWRSEVHLTTVATLYKKIRFYTRENLGAGDIHLPPEELDTEAFVLTLSEESAAELGLLAGDRAAAWRAVGGLLRRVAPLFVRCQPSDLGIATEVRSAHFKCPTIFLWDRVQGGVGLSELLFDDHESLVGAALEVAQNCACRDGCPACVGPVEQVGAFGKSMAIRILEHLARGAAPCELPVEDPDGDAVAEAPSC
ncbi:MAG: DEAD/DEAH box helicase [Planctomycetota bacterium]